MLKGNRKALEQSCSSFAMPLHIRPHMRALEPRILLDAAAMETAVDAVNEAVHAGLADDFVRSNFPQRDGQSESDLEFPKLADPLEALDLQSSTEQHSEIVFIAADIDDPQKLLAALPSSTEVVFLTADKNGLSQIAETLSLRSDVDAIHILSHGSQGALALGGDDLTFETMQSIYAAQLAMIGDALSEDGDILIYGCDFAGGDVGRKAVEAISRMTGADVAASDDLTGNAAQDGDWDLEVKSGDVETKEIATSTSWSGTLADVVLEEYSPDLSEIEDAEEIGSTRSVGQTFRHNSGNGAYEVDKVEVVLRDTGGPDQTIRVTISDSFGGVPVGEGTFNSTSITGDFEYYAITLDSVTTLVDDQLYYITLSTDNPSETIETANSRDGNYSGGQYVRPDGGFKNQHDLYFKIIDAMNNDPDITSDGGDSVENLTVDENQTYVTTVVANDIDLPGDTITYSITGGPDASFYEIDANTGVLTFINAPNFEQVLDGNGNGIYTVDVTASDGNGGSDTQQLRVTIRDINDAPIAIGGTTSTTEDTPLDISNQFVYSDEDSDLAQSITIQAMDLGGGTVTHSGGTVVYVGDTITGTNISTLMFTPALNSTDPVMIDFTSNDADQGIQIGTVTINITSENDAPIITSHSGDAIVPMNYNENQTFVSTVTASDVDLPGDTISYSITGGPDAASFVVDSVTGDLSFIAAPDFENPMDFNNNGIFRVIVTASDGNGGTAEQQFTITIANVNEVPVAINSSVTTDEDVAHAFSVTDFGYTDIESDALVSVTLTNLSLAGGTLTHSGGTAVNNGDTLTAAQIDTLVYTSAANSFADATFDYMVNDADLGTVSAVMTVRVDAVNDAPVITSDGGGDSALSNADENQTYVTTVTASDIDVPSDTITYSITGGIDAAFFEVDATTGVLNFISAPDFEQTLDNDTNGIYRVEVTASDGNGGTDKQLIRAVVGNVNEVPVATNSSVTTNEDVAHVFSVADFGYSDVESNALVSIAISNLNLIGGALTHSGGTVVNNGDTLTATQIDTLVYTSAANSSADATFDYTVNDAGLGTVSAVMTVQVDAVNDVPTFVTGGAGSIWQIDVAEGEADVVDLEAVDADLPSDTLTYSIVGGNDFDKFDIDPSTGVLTLITSPDFENPNDFGLDNDYFVLVQVSDGNGGIDTQTIRVNILDQNDLAVATGGSTNATEDVQHVIPISAFNFTDADGDSLQSITVSNLALSGGTLTHSGGTIEVSNGMTISAAEMSDLTFLPTANSFGNVSFDYTVNDDDAGLSSATLNINIAEVNDVPVATGGTASTDSDEPYTFQISDFGYIDVEGDNLQSIRIESLTLVGGTLTLSDGNVIVTEGMVIDAADVNTMVFTPEGDRLENAVIQYTVNDGDDGNIISEMVIQVAAPTNPGDIDPEEPDVLEEKAEEETEEEGEEEAEEEAEDETSTNGIFEGTTSNPAVAKAPVLAPAAQVLEEASVSVVDDLGEIEGRAILPARQTQIESPKDSYKPIPLPNHTFEPVSRRAMLEKIDQSSQDVREYSEFLGADVAKVSFTFGSLLSIGGVSWLLRGGALMAAFLSVMPAWSRFDPVTIVTSRRDENEEEESSEFDVMLAHVKDARSRVKGIPQS